MDKNIAAFLREDAKTIGVKFFRKFDENKNYDRMTLLGDDIELSKQEYTYVTDLDIAVGDIVAVYAMSTSTMAIVTRVDQDVDIPPNSDTEYRWVIQKLDFSSYMDTIAKNKIIVETCRSAYKNNARRQYRSLILADMNDESRAKLLSALSGKDEKETRTNQQVDRDGY